MTAVTLAFADYARELPVLESPRLRPRPLAEADAADLFAIFFDPEVTSF